MAYRNSKALLLNQIIVTTRDHFEIVFTVLGLLMSCSNHTEAVLRFFVVVVLPLSDSLAHFQSRMHLNNTWRAL